MKKTLLSTGIITLFGLSACGGDLPGDVTVTDETQEVVLEEPFVRVVFNPATADLNVPNDFLMIPSGNFFDFTLNTEGSDEFDPANPLHSLSALDGWSAHMPFSIRVSLTDDLDIDAASVSGSSIRIFEATQALEGTSDTCQALAVSIGAPGVPCELGEELIYGVDFVASYTSGTGAISVIPLKPMKSSQGHMLVVTEELKSTDGRAVKGSITWELARQDITTNALGSDDLLQLQGLVNSLVNVLEPVGLATADISYAAYFSTQSTEDALNTVKQLNIAPYAQAFQATLATGADLATANAVASQYLPTITTELTTGVDSVFENFSALLLSADQLAGLEAVGLNTCDGLIAAVSDPASPLNATATATFSQVGPFCSSTIVEGEVKLPYYSSTTNPANDWWRAACTSGATLQSLGTEVVTGLIQAGQVGPNNARCQVASGGTLFDLDLTSLGMTDPRNITKFSPIPALQGRQTDDVNTSYNEAGTEAVSVLFTVPDESVIAMISAATGGIVPAQTKPAGGWPVVVFQHGLGQSKSNALLVASALAMAGYASAAIDHPLHGDRIITIGEDVFDSAGYTSLILLSTRDNGRQSIADIMAFRLALNSINDSTDLVDLNTAEVHFIGQSLGAIYGTGAVALANKSLAGDLAAFDSMYAFKTANINVPTGGTSAGSFDSAVFGPIIKGQLLVATSPEFVEFLTAFAEQNGVSAEAAIGPAYLAFEQVITAEQAAVINAGFTSVSFAAQTVTDAADPISYAAELTSTTPTLVQLVVGGGNNDDGSTALTDQVNPITTSLPLVGGQPLADIMGLPKVSTSSEGSGVVRFISGSHSSLLSPTPSAATTTEMQSQAVSFIASGGTNIVVSDTSVVEN
ncbi:VolA/Pla-1 family phospholipase [Paraglaciecola sp. MB-3u-78]|uniref:VolA/Pla-1 family phospholipase n=1 Tax=Paraglaciecola sp. MB-3u-78 TaxID=2058332 RepID=UPI000C33DC72|nr:VolA/Pla-1 family phospholipase [Paraglaciecola sp. MB-3u-78]PKG99648.1 lipase [Paraglaciecola sp. MB-3u-78]